MGDLADYYIDMEIAGMGRPDLLPAPRGEVIWTTRDGKRLKPRDMGSVHLLHCLHLIERREGHMGMKPLNGSRTYQCMVDVLIGRGKLTQKYYRLPIEERLEVTLQE